MTYEDRKSDFWRLYGMCGRCKQKRWIVKRVEVNVPNGKAISPNHFCKECREIINKKLN